MGRKVVQSSRGDVRWGVEESLWTAACSKESRRGDAEMRGLVLLVRLDVSALIKFASSVSRKVTHEALKSGMKNPISFSL